MGEDLVTVVGPDGSKAVATRKAYTTTLMHQGYTLEPPKPTRTAKPKADGAKKA